MFPCRFVYCLMFTANQLAIHCQKLCVSRVSMYASCNDIQLWRRYFVPFMLMYRASFKLPSPHIRRCAIWILIPFYISSMLDIGKYFHLDFNTPWVTLQWIFSGLLILFTCLLFLFLYSPYSCASCSDTNSNQTSRWAAVGISCIYCLMTDVS